MREEEKVRYVQHAKWQASCKITYTCTVSGKQREAVMYGYGKTEESAKSDLDDMILRHKGKPAGEISTKEYA